MIVYQAVRIPEETHLAIAKDENAYETISKLVEDWGKLPDHQKHKKHFIEKIFSHTYNVKFLTDTPAYAVLQGMEENGHELNVKRHNIIRMLLVNHYTPELIFWANEEGSDAAHKE